MNFRVLNVWLCLDKNHQWQHMKAQHKLVFQVDLNSGHNFPPNSDLSDSELQDKSINSLFCFDLKIELQLKLPRQPNKSCYISSLNCLGLEM